MSFDRTGKSGVLAKLEGCFTRGIQYRWDVFRPFVDRLDTGSAVLDLGCGSLVETYYLARRQLNVTGIDLEALRLEDYERRYDWTGLPRPTLRATSLWELAKEAPRFDMIVAFDVFEHLPPLKVHSALETLRELLNPDAVLIMTVPNKLSASEFYSMVSMNLVRMSGRELEPGAPHLTVRTPPEWKQSFETAGYQIVAWEMAIGPLVNTWYVLTTGLIQWALMGLQLLRLISRTKRHLYVKRFNEFVLFPRWLQLLNFVDEACRSKLSNFFTWNLIVLKTKG